MVASRKLAEGEKPTNITWRDGKKSRFSTFKKDVIAFVSKPVDNIQFITDVGKSIFDKLVRIQADCKSAGTRFSENIEYYIKTVWAAHFGTREGGRVTAGMEVVKVFVYKSTFGAGFTSAAKAGFTDAAVYKEAQEIAVEKYLLAKCKISSAKPSTQSFLREAKRMRPQRTRNSCDPSSTLPRSRSFCKAMQY